MQKNNINILFDFDGVLVDSLDICYQCHLKNDSKFMSLENYIGLYDGNYFSSINTNVITLEEYKFFDLYSKALMLLNPMNGIENLLHELYEKGYSLYIVSSSLSQDIKQWLHKYNLEQYFEEVLGAEEGLSKSIKVNFIIDKKSNSRFLFVTDTLGDVLTMNRIGVPVIADTWGFHNRERLLMGNTIAIVDSVNDLRRKILDF